MVNVINNCKKNPQEPLPHQSGFTRGDSAINQLLFITNEFGKALDEGKEIRVVFCDISKAFDRVWHIIYKRISPLSFL
jgi:hypothetical protein